MSKQVKSSSKRTRSTKAKSLSWKVSVKPRRAGRSAVPMGCSCCGGK
ncbi:MAG: hypothetical protein QOD26_2622 [Betaproteobacteria bacterium]|nr:hypothetical protein [Betaproteobacteria bacterium]